MTQIAIRQVSIHDALTLIGWDISKPARGHVMVKRGVIRIKHYAARYRMRDGALLYRWGSLTKAQATYIDGTFSHVVFDWEA
jgi:hypothetical protein